MKSRPTWICVIVGMCFTVCLLIKLAMHKGNMECGKCGLPKEDNRVRNVSLYDEVLYFNVRNAKAIQTYRRVARMRAYEISIRHVVTCHIYPACNYS